MSAISEPIGIGFYLMPGPGGSVQVFVAEGLGVAVAALLWIVAVVLGLVTAWLVLP